MSNGNDIDLSIKADGADGVERIVSAIDRLHQAMTNLGNNSAVSRLEDQMKVMQASITAGFAGMTGQVVSGGTAVVKGIESAGAAAAKATEDAGNKIKAANARTWTQIQRGSAANVTGAFNQLAQGIPVEAVEKRFGDLATKTAQGLNGQLDQLRQFQANAKSLHTTHYKALAGASEAEIDQARAMNARWHTAMRARSASSVDPRELLGLPSRDSMKTIGQQIAAQMREGVTQENLRTKSASRVDPRELLGLPPRDSMKTIGQQIAAQMREGVTQENLRTKSASRVDPRELLGLPSRDSMKTIGQQIAAQMREGVTQETVRAKAASNIRVETLLGLPSREETKAIGRRLAAQFREGAQQELNNDRQLNLNSRFAGMDATQRYRVGQRVQNYLQQPGATQEGANRRFGSDASSSNIDVLRAAHERLAGATRTSRNGIQAHNEAMREGHSLARGLAGSLGGLWLTYGSLAPLAAGAAISSSLKAMVESGREIEYHLKFFEAFGEGKVSLDHFLKITDSTVVSVKEAAEGMRALAQNGLSAQEALAALPAVMNLSVVGEMGVGQAALAATGVATAFFGIEEAKNQITKVGDIFAQAAASSNTSVSAMTESMKQASTVASTYKVSVEETAAALGVLAQINVTGSAAGTAYTNMLTNLYAPTKQAEKALKDLGVTTDDGMGGIKNSSQLLGELKVALSRFNEPARADIMSDIFTVRGQKAATQVLDNLDAYKAKIAEAQGAAGFMGTAVAKLEDTTTGAFKRLANNVTGSLTEAFGSTSPMIQALAMNMAHVARSDGTVRLLTSMADAVARLTRTLFENAGAIAGLVAGLVALRILSGVSTMLTTVAASAAAATAGVGALTAGMRLLTMSLGWISVGLAGLVAAWKLLIETTTDVEKADQRVRNSIQTNIDYLKRETDALRERNAERDKKEGKGGPSQVETSVEDMRKRVGETEAAYWKSRRENGVQDSETLKINERWQAQKTALAELERMRDEQNALEEVLVVGTAIENHKKEKDAILEKIEAFRKQGDIMRRVNGEEVPVDPLGTAESRKIALSAKEIADQVRNDTLSASQAAVELTALQQQYNKTLADRPLKSKDASEKAVQDGRLKQLQLELDLQRQLSQYETAAARQAFKRGDIGELQLINQELAAKVALNEKEVDVARRQALVVSPAERPAKHQEYLNRKKLAEKQAVFNDLEAEEKRQTVLANMAQETVAFEAKALADRGQLVDAFNLEFASKYSETIRSVTSDLAFEENAARRATLSNYLLMLTQMETEGRRVAFGKELGNQFQAGLSSLDQLLGRLENDAAGSSIGQMFSDALAAEKALEASLPGLIAKQREMQANAVTDDEHKGAADALKAIDDRAARTRQVWVSVGKAIEKSLGDAFGKGGKAIGQMVTVYGSFSAKQKEIQANLKRDSIGKGEEDRVRLQKKANEDMVQNQLRSYSDMAGAAKGFFSENSRGYEALTKIQNVFRAFEMAMALKSMATQLFATNTVTAAKVTGTTLEKAAVVSTVPVTLAAEGTKQTAYGVSALASALTAPFPENLVAYATVAAMLAAIGVAVSGGGGSGKSLSERRQESQGTGSVLGSPKAKSESISRALDRIENNTYQGLSVSNSMLDALLGIQNALGSFAALIVRNSGLTGEGYEGLNKGYNGAGMIRGGAMIAGGVGGALAGGAVAGALTMGVTGSTSLTALGAVAGPLGMAVGAIAGALLGKVLAKPLSKVFGGKQTVQDTGFTMTKDSLGNIRQRGVTGWQYADIKKDGGWFHSDKYSTQRSSLGADANRQFGQVINSMADTIMAAGSALGIAGSDLEQRLNSFVIDIGKISLKGKSGDEIQKELEAVFSKLGDDMATWTVQGMEKFAKIGEGPLETLTRMAQEYATIDVVFQSFGKTFGQVGMASLEARARLIELSGGLEEFISQGEYFLQNFYTEAEQREKLRARIQPTLSQYGINASAPDAMMQLRRFVESLDVTTDYGARAYATMMQLAPALKDVADAAKEAADQAKDMRDEIDELMMTRAELLAKERNSLDAANRALFDQLQAAKAVAEARDRIKEAYENEKATIESTIERVKGLAQSWKEFRDSLIMGDKSTLTPEQKYAAAQAKYEETLAAARAGDTKAQDAFQSVAEAFLDASRVSNASGAGYTRDFEGVLQATKDNEAWAQREVDLAKANLDALKTQVEHLVSIDEKIGTVAQELAGYAAAYAEYLSRQAAAAAPPPGTQTTGTPTGYYERQDRAESLVGTVLKTIDRGLQMLREQQAQETQDTINSNAAEIRRASEEQAEALRKSGVDRQWQERNEAYAR